MEDPILKQKTETRRNGKLRNQTKLSLELNTQATYQAQSQTTAGHLPKVMLFTLAARGWALTIALLGVERGGGGGSQAKRGSVHIGDLCPSLRHLEQMISDLAGPEEQAASRRVE